MIKILFSGLKVVIIVYFVIFSSEIPTLLSMKDMYDSGLDIRIQERFISLGQVRHEISMEDYFLVYQYKSSYILFTLYT